MPVFQVRSEAELNAEIEEEREETRLSLRRFNKRHYDPQPGLRPTGMAMVIFFAKVCGVGAASWFFISWVFRFFPTHLK